MLEMIQGAYNGLKTAGDIAQGFIALKTEADINRAVIDIQRHVLDAQRALMEADALHSSDMRSIADFEQEIIRLKDWSAERQRYQLVDVWHGAFAYMLKPEMRAGEPAHWLCTNCFDQGRKSFMQNKGGVSDTQFGCDGCKASFRVANRVRPTYPESLA